jgi:hypothetical protein
MPTTAELTAAVEESAAEFRCVLAEGFGDGDHARGDAGRSRWGYGTAVLTASAMGHGVYERLGFRVHCRIYVPEFDPRRADGA